MAYQLSWWQFVPLSKMTWCLCEEDRWSRFLSAWLFKLPFNYWIDNHRSVIIVSMENLITMHGGCLGHCTRIQMLLCMDKIHCEFGFYQSYNWGNLEETNMSHPLQLVLPFSGLQPLAEPKKITGGASVWFITNNENIQKNEYKMDTRSDGTSLVVCCLSKLMSLSIY